MNRALAALACALVACSAEGTSASASGSGGGGAATSSASSASSASGASTTTGASSEICDPGAERPCTCFDGRSGAQRCAAAGDGYGACEGCEAGSGGSGGTESTSASATGAGGAGGGDCDAYGEEPNEDEPTATDFGKIDDCDNDGELVVGILAAEDDADWYRYDGNDSAGCSVNPGFTVTSDAPLRVCQFVDCNSGTAEFECPGNTTDATSPEGHPGCCSVIKSSASSKIDPNCSGIDDDATVYVRLDAPGPAGAGGVCVPYTIYAHY